MENVSLYDYIERLKQVKENCTQRAQNSRLTPNEARGVRAKMSEKIKLINAELDKIEKEYPIDFKLLAGIISEQTNKDYKLKKFRETETIWEVKDDVMKPNKYFTGRYVIAYVNKDNKFFNHKESTLGDSYMNSNEYSDMLETLNQTNSIVLRSSDGFGLDEWLSYGIVEYKNYMSLITRDERFYEDFYAETTNKIKQMIINVLKISKLKQEDATTTEDLRL